MPMRPRATAGANIRPRILDCRSATVWTVTGVGDGVGKGVAVGFGVGVVFCFGVGVGLARDSLRVSAETETPEIMPIDIDMIATKTTRLCR